MNRNLQSFQNNSKGFGLGGDDYITKPFSAMALLMRVRAIFRRIEYEKEKHGVSFRQSIKVGNLLLDGNRRSIMNGDQVLPLTPTEYEVLKYLMMHAGQAVSREELLSAVWGFESIVETRATDDTVRRLRKKMMDCGAVISAVWGYGFRMEEI